MNKGMVAHGEHLIKQFYNYAYHGLTRAEFLLETNEAWLYLFEAEIIALAVQENSFSYYFYLQQDGVQRFMRLDPDKAKKRLSEAFVGKSVLTAEFEAEDNIYGLVMVANPKRFVNQKILEKTAGPFAQALALRRSQAAFKERLKELTCLYKINDFLQEDISIETFCQRLLFIIPPAFQYPALTQARLEVFGRTYKTDGFKPQAGCLSSDLLLDNKVIGKLQVIYTQSEVTTEPALFLSEEQKLLDLISERISRVLERFEASRERNELQSKLLHADRLATVGQLAAGVAHEINEPLAGILGYAQLAQRSLSDPVQARRDLDKIVQASLNARDIVKKLLFFSRQMPADKKHVNINTVVEEALFFINFRCRREKIDVVLNLAENLPELTVDPVQINQVVVNLTLNAIQAMDGGGVLQVTTEGATGGVQLRITDNGCGMDKKTLERIFLPFFTTKDLGEGTGLGLSVVHGIISSHKGRVDVTSEPGKGTEFVVFLPVE